MMLEFFFLKMSFYAPKLWHNNTNETNLLILLVWNLYIGNCWYSNITKYIPISNGIAWDNLYLYYLNIPKYRYLSSSWQMNFWPIGHNSRGTPIPVACRLRNIQLVWIWNQHFILYILHDTLLTTLRTNLTTSY